MWHMTCIDCNKGPNKALWQDLSHTAYIVWEHSVHIDWELLTTTKVLNRSLSAYLAFMYSVQFFCSVQYLVYDPNSSPNCQENQNFIHFILCKKEKPKKKKTFIVECCVKALKNCSNEFGCNHIFTFLNPYKGNKNFILLLVLSSFI